MKRKKSILLARADALGNLDHLKQEIDDVFELLTSAKLVNRLVVHKEESFRLSRLFLRINNAYSQKVDFLHYCGHSDEENIYLERDRDARHDLDVNDFVQFLKNQQEIKILFLNSCSSNVLGGKLLEESTSVEAVIETTREVPDKEAKDFAVDFYRGLRDGKNLKEAFENAAINQSGQKPKIEDYEITRPTRGIVFRLKPKEDGDTSLIWKLSYKNEEFVEAWRLLPKNIVSKLKELSEDTIKILCLYGEEETDNSYYQGLKKSFSSVEKVFFYSFWEDIWYNQNLKEEEKVFALEASNAHFHLLTSSLIEGLKAIKDEEIFKGINKKPAALIGCSGEIKDHQDFLQKNDLISSSFLLTPELASAGLTLNKLAKLDADDPEILLGKYCKDLKSLLFINEEELAGHLLNLNFNTQRTRYAKIFTEQALAVKDKRLFWIMIDGTQFCAQEALIKALSNQPGATFDLKKIGYSVESLCFLENAKNLKDEELEKILWMRIGTHINPNSYSFDHEATLRIIEEKRANENLVFILNDVNIDQYANIARVLEKIWNKMLKATEKWNKDIPNRFFFFVIHKSSNKSFPKGVFKNPEKPSVCYAIDLDRIAPLTLSDFSLWFSNASRTVRPHHVFHTLRGKEKEVIKADKEYMQNVIAAIGQILKHPEISANILKI